MATSDVTSAVTSDDDVEGNDVTSSTDDGATLNVCSDEGTPLKNCFRLVLLGSSEVVR